LAKSVSELGRGASKNCPSSGTGKRTEGVLKPKQKGAGVGKGAAQLNGQDPVGGHSVGIVKGG